MICLIDRNALNQGLLKNRWTGTLQEKISAPLILQTENVLYIFLKLLCSLENMQKEFLKSFDFCLVFSNVFESGIALGKVSMVTILIIPCPCSHHFTPTSWARSTENFIKIHCVALVFAQPFCYLPLKWISERTNQAAKTNDSSFCSPRC